jgi:hypothetical protein
MEWHFPVNFRGGGRYKLTNDEQVQYPFQFPFQFPSSTALVGLAFGVVRADWLRRRF